MHVQLRPLIQQAHTLKDSDVDGMIANAVKVKREGDAKKINNMCTPRTITLYLESSLLFMEACETLLRQPRTSERVQRSVTVVSHDVAVCCPALLAMGAQQLSNGAACWCREPSMCAMDRTDVR